MASKMRRWLKGEEGITGLETAIILIAFVVVAAVFAFTVLSAGIFSADRSKEAVYAGLGEVRGSMEVRGSIVANASTTGASGYVDDAVFTVGNVAGGEGVDLTAPTGCTNGIAGSSSTHKLRVDYRDKYQSKQDLCWTLAWKGTNDADALMEDGELAQLTVPLTATTVLSPSLGINKTFRIEMKPDKGSTIVLERTTPGVIDAVMDLQ